MKLALNKQWMLALFSVLFLWGINNVLLGIGAKVLQGNAIIYSCTAFATGSLILLLYAGPGALAKETMRSIDTWVYGITLLIGYSLSFILYFYVSSTEGTLLQRFSVIISLLIGWFFLSRTPSKGQALGASLIIVGVASILYGIEGENSVNIYVIMIAFAIFQALRIFAAEYHRPHAKASSSENSPKAKARVVGCVMFIVSLFFAIITFLLAIAQSGADSSQIIKGLPVLADFFNTGNVILGLFAGMFILAPLLLIEFSSSQSIKTENYLALTSLAAISTLFWEYLASLFIDISLKGFSGADAFACFLITAGGLMIATFKYKQSKIQNIEMYVSYSIQNPEDIDESRDIVANTLEHFNSDMSKAAKALDVPVKVINAILEDQEKVLAFNSTVFKDVARNYRRNVATADALTGLMNRTSFMTALKTASYESNDLSLFFIDLNKFKPVNDTYGHDAGDFVLQVIADRLTQLFPHKALITRLGGDEYCILLLDTVKKQAEEKINIILAELEKNIEYKEHNISVSGSIGLANYPADTNNVEELINLADKQMYICKKEGA